MVLDTMVLTVRPIACNPMLPSYRAALFRSRCSDWPHLSSNNPPAQSPVSEITRSNPREKSLCYMHLTFQTMRRALICLQLLFSLPSSLFVSSMSRIYKCKAITYCYVSPTIYGRDKHIMYTVTETINQLYGI